MPPAKCSPVARSDRPINESAACLIFCWGNPSRGDDAIGPVVHDWLAERLPTGVGLVNDFQLQIEHTVDLEQCQRALFVDASVDTEAPYSLQPLQACHDNSYTTHAMSPASLLHVFEQVNGRAPPPAYLLSVRGYDFELGAELSGQARDNISQACDLILQLCAESRHELWPQLALQARSG